AAARLLPLLDLTSLNEADTPDTIAALCRKASSPAHKVAAVCVYARFVAQAKELLRGSGVRVATVANFPDAQASPSEVADEISAALAAGADEIDVVIHFFKSYPVAESVMESARQASDGKTLKVILETGLMGDRVAVMKAAAAAILGGADFIKTSTGKTPIGATPEAAAAMLDGIRRFGQGREIGFKASGGIRTIAQAWIYIDLAERMIGRSFVQPARFRFGASGLLDDILAAVGDGGASSSMSDY
ncbi:MAG: deoxyribose-phosphate aldolase, partial [Dongiaceae bacterium]